MKRKNYNISLSSPSYSISKDDDLRFVFDQIKLSGINPYGENIGEFEAAIDTYLNSGYSLALNSGTSAIHLALILLDIRAGDEVLCSTFTYAASVFPILYQKAIPIFIDSEELTWNICPILLEESIKDRISRGKKPKALILVYTYGMPSKLNEIVAICNKYDIDIIEDAAEALGSTYNNNPLGTFGQFGIFSFNGNKIVTTSGGGMLICKDKSDYERGLFIASQSKDNLAYYNHTDIGYNYRMDNISAIIGVSQIKSLDERINKKRNIFNYYKEKLSYIDNIIFLEEAEGSFSNRWLTTIYIDDDSIDIQELNSIFEKAFIESRFLWKPMHMQPVLVKYPSYLNGFSQKLFKKGLCLPSDTNLSIDELDLVIHIIIKFLKR